jgi:hypoxia up-regulated 1
MGLAVVILSMLAICSQVQASLMAVDLGSEFIKVSLIKPGRTPISIVVNEMSKRKTPALVGFAPDGERLLGEEAFSFAARYPETVYARTRDLLGKTAEDETLKAMLDEHMLPYKLVAHPSRPGVAAMQFNSTTAFAAEELVVGGEWKGCLLNRSLQIQPPLRD